MSGRPAAWSRLFFCLLFHVKCPFFSSKKRRKKSCFFFPTFYSKSPNVVNRVWWGWTGKCLSESERRVLSHEAHPTWRGTHRAGSKKRSPGATDRSPAGGENHNVEIHYEVAGSARPSIHPLWFHHARLLAVIQPEHTYNSSLNKEQGTRESRSYGKWSATWEPSSQFITHDISPMKWYYLIWDIAKLNEKQTIKS